MKASQRAASLDPAATDAMAREDQAAWRRRVPLVVLAAVVLVLRHLLTSHGGTWSDLMAVTAFTAVGLAITLTVVPLVLRMAAGTATTATVVLGVLALLSLVFFFSGAPFVVGFGAWFLSRTGLVRSVGGARPKVTTALGLLAMVLCVAYAVLGVVQHWAPGLPHA